MLMNIPYPDPKLNPVLHAMVREMGGRVELQGEGAVGFSIGESRFLLMSKDSRVLVGVAGTDEPMVDVGGYEEIRKGLERDGYLEAAS